jgi:hypothetical protein
MFSSSILFCLETSFAEGTFDLSFLVSAAREYGWITGHMGPLVIFAFLAEPDVFFPAPLDVLPL